jgi:two-component system, OmpR family, sensor histidine kinase VicK
MDALLVKAESPEQHDVLIAAKDLMDPILEDLARLAAEACDAPVGMVCLIEADSGQLRAVAGLGGSRLELSRSLLSRPGEIFGDGAEIISIEDLEIDPQFAPHGLVMGTRSYRYLAASPVIVDRTRVGVVAVLDDAPRELTLVQAKILGALARQAATQVEMNERSRQMELTAAVQQRMVSSVLNTIGALVVVLDMDGRIVRFNEACEEASGYSFEEVAGGRIWDRMILEEEIEETIASFDRLRKGSFPASFESRWRHSDGSIRHLTWAATALRNGDGEVAYVIATGSDVTEQRARDLTLRESEARYRQLVESSLGMVFTHDMDGRLLSINGYGSATVGRTVEEMVGHALEDFVSPKRRAAMREYMETIAAKGETQGLLHLAHADGGLRVVAYRNKLITVPERAPYVLGMGVDITEQVRAERELRTLTRQSDSILESVGDGIFCIDLEGRVTLVNTAAAQMLGYRQEEMLGRQMHALIHHSRPDGTAYPSEDSPIHRSLVSFGTVRLRDEMFWRKDGTGIPVEYVARPLLDTHLHESGEIRAVGVVVAFTDTTERRALDRLKDEFISTVSHELRTPLTSLRAALGLLNGALEDRPEKSQQMLEIALSNTDRLSRLINDIVDLERISSGKSELHLDMADAGDLVQKAVEKTSEESPMLAQEIRSRIRCAADPVGVWCDRERIVQVLCNLLSNAIKFSTLADEIEVTARTMGQQMVMFKVRDRGIGIQADRLEHVFDRFRQGDGSDSRALGGTGLGLAICRSIVTQHGGRIWATSLPGKGTTVHFTLPMRPQTHLR